MLANPPIYDTRNKSTLANPFPVYAHLRKEDPVHWHPRLKSWVLTRYDDVKRAHMSKDLSPDRITPFYANLPEKQRSVLQEVIRYLNLWMVFRDPPRHTHLRKIMNTAFTPRAIAELAPNIEYIVRQLLDRLDPSDSVDLVTEFATPLPALVIMDILGVPHEMLPKIKYWSDDMMVFIGSAQGVPDKYERARSGSEAMAAYFRDVIQDRRRNLGEDILSKMITAQEDGEGLSEDELIASCMLILFAGHETTTNMVSGAFYMLHKFPDQKQRLIENSDIIDSAVEEFLRYDGPSNALARIVVKEHEISEKTLKVGDRVFAMSNSANRDGDQFSDPDVLDLTRKKNRHLTFGYGTHFCLGASLARLEGKIAINQFLERFPNYTCLDTVPLDWIDSLSMRGLHNLPTKLS
ncbi:MAG: cytochrome P450 [Sneathiella sp.]|uniref:cytochrome P450 n=1 Tax=Sneathiella sp. TaxID=1964365 RepID=UPI00300328EE